MTDQRPREDEGPRVRLHDVCIEGDFRDLEDRGDQGADGDRGVDLGGPAVAEAIQRALAEAMAGDPAVRAAMTGDAAVRAAIAAQVASQIGDQVAAQVSDQGASAAVSRVTS